MQVSPGRVAPHYLAYPRSTCTKHTNIDASRAVVHSAINFTQRKREYDTVKPYVMRYRDANCPASNLELDIMDTAIHDLRGGKKTCLDVEGFELVPCETKMSHGCYFDNELVESVYLEELRKLLQERYRADRVEFVRHNIRKRDPTFPISTGSAYAHDQPAQMAHIDITTDRAMQIVQDMFDVELDEVPTFTVVNIWKPIRGPLYDWPLAMCDASTVDYESDIMSADLLWPDEVVENCMVFHNASHKWYYFRGQTPCELLIFRQMDSTRPENNGVPHSAFLNPLTPVGEVPRESIEVQAILFFGAEVVSLDRTLKYPVYKH